MVFTNNPIRIHAPAKINLTLNVTGRREDGYHLLHSLTTFSDYCDYITLFPHDEFKFTIDSHVSDVPEDENNLIVKTAKKLAKNYDQNLNCHIHCEKNIPLGAGLGGGSTDAAATVKALLKFWDITPNAQELNNLLLSLGADIPVCHYTKPCLFEGVGEIITPIENMPQLQAVLVYPNQHSSTPEIFKSFDQDFSTKTELNKDENILNFIKLQSNDLTPSAVKNTPIIQDVLVNIAKTPNCLVSRMSGSGSCCFGLYKIIEDAQAAENKIKKEKPGWWVKSVTLKGI